MIGDGREGTRQLMDAALPISAAIASPLLLSWSEAIFRRRSIDRVRSCGRSCGLDRKMMGDLSGPLCWQLRLRARLSTAEGDTECMVRPEDHLAVIDQA
jgi:hypothetical protein